MVKYKIIPFVQEAQGKRYCYGIFRPEEREDLYILYLGRNQGTLEELIQRIRDASILWGREDLVDLAQRTQEEKEHLKVILRKRNLLSEVQWFDNKAYQYFADQLFPN